MKRKIAFIFLLTCLTFVSCRTSKPSTHTHAFGNWTIVKAATCTEPGKRERVCSCGEKQTQSIAAGHKYSDWTTITRATCTNEGKKTHKCTACGKSEEVMISAAGHKWNNATCTVAKRCSVCGATEGAALGHNYQNGVCTRCSYEKKGEIAVTNPTPFKTKNTFGYQTEIQINKLDVQATGSGLTLTVSGVKTYDQGGNTANNYVGFAIIVKDNLGNIVGSDNIAFTPGVVNQAFFYSFDINIANFNIENDYTVTFYDRTSL